MKDEPFLKYSRAQLYFSHSPFSILKEIPSGLFLLQEGLWDMGEILKALNLNFCDVFINA